MQSNLVSYDTITNESWQNILKKYIKQYYIIKSCKKLRVVQLIQVKK